MEDRADNETVQVPNSRPIETILDTTSRSANATANDLSKAMITKVKMHTQMERHDFAKNKPSGTVTPPRAQNN